MRKKVSNAFGWIASFAAIAAVLCGGPMQIHMNAAKQQCGQPIAAVCLSFGVVSSRLVYLSLEKQWKHALPEMLSMIVSTILLWQYWTYPVIVK